MLQRQIVCFNSFVCFPRRQPSLNAKQQRIIIITFIAANEGLLQSQEIWNFSSVIFTSLPETQTSFINWAPTLMFYVVEGENILKCSAWRNIHEVMEVMERMSTRCHVPPHRGDFTSLPASAKTMYWFGEPSKYTETFQDFAALTSATSTIFIFHYTAWHKHVPAFAAPDPSTT